MMILDVSGLEYQKNMPSTAINFSMGLSQISIHKQPHESNEKLMILLQSVNSRDYMTEFL